MFRTTVFRSKLLAGGLVAAFVLLLMPLPNFSQDQERALVRQGSLQGNLYTEGMTARVSGALVKIRNLNNQKEFVSQMTDGKGGYKIVGIEEGWYTLSVTTPAGEFSLNYGVYIKAGETAKLSLEMIPGGMLEGKGGRAGGGGGGFFSSTGGILLVVAVGAGAGVAIWQLTRKENEASPIR